MNLYINTTVDIYTQTANYTSLWCQSCKKSVVIFVKCISHDYFLGIYFAVSRLVQWKHRWYVSHSSLIHQTWIYGGEYYLNLFYVFFIYCILLILITFQVRQEPAKISLVCFVISVDALRLQNRSKILPNVWENVTSFMSAAKLMSKTSHGRQSQRLLWKMYDSGLVERRAGPPEVQWCEGTNSPARPLLLLYD